MDDPKSKESSRRERDRKRNQKPCCARTLAVISDLREIVLWRHFTGAATK